MTVTGHGLQQDTAIRLRYDVKFGVGEKLNTHVLCFDLDRFSPVHLEPERRDTDAEDMEVVGVKGNLAVDKRTGRITTVSLHWESLP